MFSSNQWLSRLGAARKHTFLNQRVVGRVTKHHLGGALLDAGVYDRIGSRWQIER